jgi:hypothetical protein
VVTTLQVEAQVGKEMLAREQGIMALLVKAHIVPCETS